MTPSELKYHCEERGSKFFTRNNMRFAGDTMKNYGVRAKPVTITRYDGSTMQAWELYRKHPVKHGLNSSAFFAVDTYVQVWSKS